MSERPVGRCIGCWHDFTTGPCGGCGAVMGADDLPRLPHPSDHRDEEPQDPRPYAVRSAEAAQQYKAAS